MGQGKLWKERGEERLNGGVKKLGEQLKERTNGTDEKKRVKEEWTLSIAENFKENKKKFWKGVNEVRMGESLRSLSMRNSMGEGLAQENDSEGRWKEYFVQLLSGDEITEVGRDVRRERIEQKERVVREVVREEIMGAIKKMKGGEAVGTEGIAV